MDPLGAVRSWIFDLHRLGYPLSRAAKASVERATIAAAQRGATLEEVLAEARRALQHSRTPPRTRHVRPPRF